MDRVPVRLLRDTEELKCVLPALLLPLKKPWTSDSKHLAVAAAQRLSGRREEKSREIPPSWVERGQQRRDAHADRHSHVCRGGHASGNERDQRLIKKGEESEKKEEDTLGRRKDTRDEKRRRL